MEVILNKKDGTPFVTKEGDKYFIEKVEYTDDVQILLNAVANVKEGKYQDLHSGYTTKEAHWQAHFNHQWTAGGLILWHNPTEMWNQELCRKGKLACEKCGSIMYMHYRPICTKCHVPEKDRKGRYDFFEVCRYVEEQLGEYDPNRSRREDLAHRIMHKYGEFHNDSVIDLYMPDEEDIEDDEEEAEWAKDLEKLNQFFPLDTTNFYLSW